MCFGPPVHISVPLLRLYDKHGCLRLYYTRYVMWQQVSGDVGRDVLDAFADVNVI